VWRWDRALLLVAFAGPLRRSEVTALRTRDTVLTSEAILILHPRTLIIQRGSEAQTCPVAAVRAYLEATHIASGPLWRTSEATCDYVADDIGDTGGPGAFVFFTTRISIDGRHASLEAASYVSAAEVHQPARQSADRMVYASRCHDEGPCRVVDL